MTMQPPGFGYPAPVPPQARGGGAAKYMGRARGVPGLAARRRRPRLVGLEARRRPEHRRNVHISADDPGPSPFTDSVASVDRDDIVPVARETYAGGVEGGTEQLYGGSGSGRCATPKG